MKLYFKMLVVMLVLCLLPFTINSVQGQDIIWQETEHLNEVPAHCLLKHQQRIYSGTIGAGLLFTDDDGDTWQQAEKIPSSFIVDLIEIDNRTIMGATRDKGVVISEDAGESWRTLNEGLEMHRTNCLFKDRETIYVGTDLGIYRLLPDSESWELLNIPREVSASRLILTIGGFRETLFAGGPGVLYYSTDAGETWDAITEAFDFNVTSLLWQANHLYIGTSGDGLLRTDGPGNDRIEDLTEGVFDQASNSVWRLREINGKIYKLTSSRGLVNDSLSVNDGLVGLEVRDILKHGRYYFLASGTQGVLRTDKDLDLKSLDQSNGQAFQLLAYPTITSSEVTLDLKGITEGKGTEIFFVDGRGQKVKTLHIEPTKNSEASRRILLSQLSSGSYWIVAQNGDRLSRQLIIINR